MPASASTRTACLSKMSIPLPAMRHRRALATGAFRRGLPSYDDNDQRHSKHRARSGIRQRSYRSGGIRLYYPETTGTKSVLKDGVLLEAGFDTVAPNIDKDISSWAYDFASSLAVPCYELGYTLVEKLQTISTKYRKQQETGQFPVNFLRHYYDVYCLLDQPDVQAFIGADDYLAHKTRR
ncbi:MULTISPECIES: nucleotidyl transferase AbiEii/AbiGii toxin family protein [unclassified Ensifer]|uniref:nucleotidyl transferase AbiEii/AbiGii toxin family protein n=1 Tax=unclassified Ensifer TaxID=2633371 RepID=UPI000B182291|nr:MULTISPECIES: nucleotidyl transferase AbiEii/AbiGii toxin family protein [unclassified Ensifer]